MANEKLIEAFHLMWDNFPEAVRLTYKDRTIIVNNKASENTEWQVGIKCSSVPPLERHKFCKANETMKNCIPTYEKIGEMISYWIPIDGYADYFIHFAVRMNKY